MKSLVSKNCTMGQLLSLIGMDKRFAHIRAHDHSYCVGSPSLSKNAL